MADFKLIEKDTDIDSLDIKPLNWDVVIRDIPYYVAHIPGYIHTIGGKWGDNDLWAYPRNEEPSYENLVEFTSSEIVRWGLEFRSNFYFKTKYGECEMRHSSGTMITRNGRDFYFVAGGMDYSLSKARMLITKVQEGVLDVNSIDFDKKLKGKVITYKGLPAKVEQYINGQGCIIISYIGPDKYKFLADKIWRCEDDDCVKLDVIGYDHHDIDWFPQFRDETELNLIQIFLKYFDLKDTSSENK